MRRLVGVGPEATDAGGFRGCRSGGSGRDKAVRGRAGSWRQRSLDNFFRDGREVAAKGAEFFGRQARNERQVAAEGTEFFSVGMGNDRQITSKGTDLVG